MGSNDPKKNVTSGLAILPQLLRPEIGGWRRGGGSQSHTPAAPVGLFLGTFSAVLIVSRWFLHIPAPPSTPVWELAHLLCPPDFPTQWDPELSSSPPLRGGLSCSATTSQKPAPALRGLSGITCGDHVICRSLMRRAIFRRVKAPDLSQKIFHSCLSSTTAWFPVVVEAAMLASPVVLWCRERPPRKETKPPAPSSTRPMRNRGCNTSCWQKWESG